MEENEEKWKFLGIVCPLEEIKTSIDIFFIQKHIIMMIIKQNYQIKSHLVQFKGYIGPQREPK